jgi:hypothetical protein
MISQYWIDQIPSRPLAIQVKNSAGDDMDLSGYSTITARMVGSRNEELNLTGYSLNTLNKDLGKIVFIWPTDRSLFTEAGDYVLQLKLQGTGRLDFTTTHTLRVRELGKVR